ncbi:hypothetical protein [Sphingomonas sp.]|uniref:hypothetical protein n=1 Tax=Sphingomonas sp. TaxID=28214 RepID=UPI002EDB00CC
MAEFGDFSAALIRLGEMMPERTTIAQASFFLLAALADLAGKPARFSDIREAAGGHLNRSMHTTYKLFLGGVRRRRTTNNAEGLGWLYREENPADNREKFLKLTPEGRQVMRDLLAALTGKEVW